MICLSVFCSMIQSTRQYTCPHRRQRLHSYALNRPVPAGHTFIMEPFGSIRDPSDTDILRARFVTIWSTATPTACRCRMPGMSRDMVFRVRRQRFQQPEQSASVLRRPERITRTESDHVSECRRYHAASTYYWLGHTLSTVLLFRRDPIAPIVLRGTLRPKSYVREYRSERSEKKVRHVTGVTNSTSSFAEAECHFV